MYKWYNNGVSEIHANELTDIPKGYVPGRIISAKLKGNTLSEETKQKISESRKGQASPRKGTHESEKHVYYTNGEISIRIPESETPPEGFAKGRLKRKMTEEEKDAFNKKRKETCANKYGDVNYNNLDKRKNTCQEKYGVDNPQKSKEVQEKTKNTCYNRYGVECVFQSEQTKKKTRETLTVKYGVDNISKSTENKEKITQSWVNKSIEEINEILEKRRQTNLERYGTDSTSRLKEVIDKVSATCLERYGVAFYCLSDDYKLSVKSDSKPNHSFAELLEANGILYEREFVIDRKRYDFKVENNLIEINPTATHNSTWGIFNREMSNRYHFDKTNLARENGYRCINVWDWDSADKVLELLKPRTRIFGRNCEVKEVSQSDCSSFLEAHHFQGNAKASIGIALLYKGEIVSVMTFDTPRYNKRYQYELIRYCSSYNIIGGAEKLFNYFVNHFQPESIVSYCDYSKFNGDTYIKLGFSFDEVRISKHWYNMKTKLHITDNLLRQRGFDQLFGANYGKGTSNDELMKEAGFVEIYDAGQARYSWYKDK